MIKIIEYSNNYIEDVKNLLVELQNYIVNIDDEKIQKLKNEYKEKYFDLTYSKIKKYSGKIFLAQENNNIVGLIAGIIEEKDEEDKLTNSCPKRGKILELIITKQFRGKHIGNQLLNAIETYLISLNCDYVSNDVFAPNQNALKFYTKEGYKERNIEIIKKLKEHT